MNVDVAAYCRLCAALKTLDNLIDLKYDKKKRREIFEKLTRIYPGIEQAQGTLSDLILVQQVKQEEDEWQDIEFLEEEILYEPPEDENIELKSDLKDSKTDDYLESKTLTQIDTSCNVANSIPFVIINENEPQDKNDINLGNDTSWTGYKWLCRHCKFKCEDMETLRTHSKEHHNVCFAYKCVDCAEKLRFNTFNAFIEHVRLHREVLRYYCQYCNKKFESKEQCFEHTLAHWEGLQKICSQCGEICANPDCLERHRKVYKKCKFAKNYPTKQQIIELSAEEEKSWASYDWACQECFLKLPDVSTLRQHVQNIHNKCFAIKCADCLRVMRNYRSFAAHVITHRPYLAKYCQYCNMHIQDSNNLQQHIDDHFNGPQRPCHGCGQIFPDNRQVSQHMKIYNSPRFISALTTEDLTCDICSKVLKNIVAFRHHRKCHSEKKYIYTCDTCGKAFSRRHELNDHIKTHSVATEICEVCDKKFYTKSQLKAHGATHNETRSFICNYCGNGYKSKRQLYLHLIIHRDVKKYKCSFCSREFNYKDNLRTHEYQHTGQRPYSCPHCDRTFTNPGNRKKHVVRCQGVSTAKRTALRKPRETKSVSDSNAKERFSGNTGKKLLKKSGDKR